MMIPQSFTIENKHQGATCGIDEVGRGPLAGPVVAACVYIPDAVREMDFIAGIKDSKKLSWTKLEALYALITEHCAYGIAEVGAAEIDEINILQASLRAMGRAYDEMSFRAQREISPPSGDSSDYAVRNDREKWHALIDGNKIPTNLPCSAEAVIKGDSKSKSIAAASIVAKYTRDTIMHKLAAAHPHYGWETNVGYPSKAHLAGIDAHGITEHHRRSYAPVKNFIEFGTTKKRA